MESSGRPPQAVIAAILAGGRGRRMGRPKAGVAFRGAPLLAHAAAAATAAGLRPVAVVKSSSVLPSVAVERWDEPDVPRHPLHGVATALRRAGAPIVVLPVDLPLVPPGLLRALADHPAPLVVVAAAGRLHPLLGRFSPVHADALARAAVEGAPVVRTVTRLGAVVLDEQTLAAFGDPAVYLRNVNAPEDLLERPDAAG